MSSMLWAEEGLYQPRVKLRDTSTDDRYLVPIKPLLDLRVWSFGVYDFDKKQLPDIKSILIFLGIRLSASHTADQRY